MNEASFIELEKKLKSIKIEAFIIHQGENRIFEYLKNKKIAEKPAKVYSITKSIVSILIGIMVDKGMIKDIHEPIQNYFPDLDALKDPQKREITIFHLLTMTSGLQAGQFQGSKNRIKFIVEQPITHEPGSTFQYNSGDSHLLSAIIQKISGFTTAAFAERHLFYPLGIHKYIWVKDPQGINGGGFSLSLNVEDMVKIGLLFLKEGRFNSKQIISSNWLHQAKTPYKQFETEREGTAGYGYQLWTYKSTINPIDYYYANGLYGQYIFIVPKLNMIAVAKSHLQDDQQQSAPRLFFDEIIGSWLKKND
ncbi:6-aminohexanoate-dimer hydrolase [Sporosarcina sp. NCCP-2222]|uniref:serine hydrolase domain-containing protein n=1 Tax=Sporosarcina sp. NCCP-2222 TaxID=2935073 RepID=UPI00208052D3|nr:serine hydrolase [Sporosarcina sp. NCCP-2222]GKV54877.1 6-aminohexanoate-dimer hydrolase [Sporosarcina sp. NCCP-2222]